MSRRGQVLDNPVTGERVVVLTDPEEHPEKVLVAHLFVRPGGRVALAHRHPTIVERFHVLRGQVGFLIGEEKHLLGPGESAEVPAGELHDWWQVGDEEAEVVVEVTPGDRFVEMVGTFFGLARDGKSDRKGVLAPLGRMLGKRPYYPEYVTSDVVVEPDPAALALLTPDGRLA
jgi:quercetin dioxygenase-like cupin family protein